MGLQGLGQQLHVGAGCFMHGWCLPPPLPEALSFKSALPRAHPCPRSDPRATGRPAVEGQQGDAVPDGHAA